VSIVSKHQKSCRSTQHLGCFKAEAAALEEIFHLKDTSRGEDFLPPDRFGAMKKTNNTFDFPTLLLLVLLELEKNGFIYC